MARKKRPTILQGSLDLLILQTLKGQSMHGYSITRHLKQASDDFFQVEEGSLYPALHRMEKRGWIESHWGTSESNRKAKFYQLTSEGKKQLRSETKSWREMSGAIDQILNFQS